MSGIVGIVNLDGAPVDQDLLWRMTHLMSFRGPDAQEIWIDGNVSFGHTLLRTTWEGDRENQPLTLDGRFWLTADARIDGRAGLINALKDKLAGRLHMRSLNDAELILYAYEAWGEDCVKHLIGDFAFAIWDGRKRCLFCARDHFGIKPFYYAHVGNVFVFGNTLESILIHPDISRTLNDQAIGDLLLFDFNRDPASTSFEDIVRIPPAHTLTLEPAVGKLTTRRFWNIPTEVDTRRHPQSYYLECFEELFDAAVEDRLRTDKVELLMSGGLDSTAIASAAVRIGQERNRELGVRAQCV